MTMIYMTGWSDTQTYEKLCREKGFNPAQKKVVFIFPGNSGHHTKDVTLFSIKNGSGLATAARVIGKSGYPVLSLPTTTMENWDNNKSQQATVQKAIEDLYQAFGAGFSFMLPVRNHDNTTYFDHGLNPDESMEPSFWGGVQLAANKPLANHYITELNKFMAFMALTPEERLQDVEKNPDNPFYKAWTRGCTMAKNDPWLRPIRKMPIPASYESFFQNNDTPFDTLNNIRELLNDYTKSNSRIKRFFHGHWDRHHVVAVHAIVEKIDNQSLQTIEDVIKELKTINLVNPQGSLARRIYFIEEQSGVHVDNTKDPLAPSF